MRRLDGILYEAAKNFILISKLQDQIKKSKPTAADILS
jgi:hypothetical protein